MIAYRSIKDYIMRSFFPPGLTAVIYPQSDERHYSPTEAGNKNSPSFELPLLGEEKLYWVGMLSGWAWIFLHRSQSTEAPATAARLPRIFPMACQAAAGSASGSVCWVRLAFWLADLHSRAPA